MHYYEQQDGRHSLSNRCASVCDGSPQEPRTLVAQPTFTFPTDACLFSISVLTVLIQRLGGLNFRFAVYILMKLVFAVLVQ